MDKAHRQENVTTRLGRGLPGSSTLALLLIMMTAVAWKALLLLLDLVPFNADEAIVGLMARHILEGNVPTFFYGQAYMGSLDAILVAVFMAVFGSYVWVIRAVQVLLYAGLILLVFRLAKQLIGTRSGALAAAILLAIPAVNITLYTTVSLGGYNEALLIGAGVLLLLQKTESNGFARWRLFALGALVGLGVWAFGLTLVFSIPVLIGLFVLIVRQRDEFPLGPSFGLVLLGAVLGALPWLSWAVLNGPEQVVRELLGSAIAGASQGGLLESWLVHLRNLLLFAPTVALGLRPPWSTEPLLPYFIPIVLVAWIGVAVLSWRRLRDGGVSVTMRALLASGALLGLGFIVTPFGADPSGRYFLPWVLPMTVLAGAAFDRLQRSNRPMLGWLMVLVLVAFHAGSTLQAAYRHGEGLTTQFDPVARVDFSAIDELITFLQSEGIERGYTNYWVAYPLAFKTDEQLIFVPSLPYHLDFRYTDRYNRYDPYNQLVSEANQVAYITTNHPELNQALQRAFSDQAIDFEVETIAPFTVFYDLSRAVSPQQLDLPHQAGAEQ